MGRIKMFTVVVVHPALGVLNFSEKLRVECLRPEALQFGSGAWAIKGDAANRRLTWRV